MENQTLTIALALVSITASLALFINWASSKHVPGLFSIALGFALTAAGTLLLTTQGIVSPLISVVLANALLQGGRLPVLLGLARFWNQEKSQLPLFCAVWFLGTVIGIYYFTAIDESALWRIRLFTVMSVMLSLCYVYVLINGLKIERHLRPVMAITTTYGSFVLIALFTINSIAEFVLMLLRSDQPLAASDISTSLILLGGILTVMVFSYGVIIMTMEELAVEHNENSIYDPITTILNHRTFLEVGQRVLGVALRYSKPVSLLLIEVSNLDQIVNTFGTRIGNELLRHFSMLATDRRRNEDVLARSSFNEFRLLLPGVDEKGADIVIEKIKKSLQGEDFIYRGKRLDIVVNIASITRREEDLHLLQMLQEGELALFKVKQ